MIFLVVSWVAAGCLCLLYIAVGLVAAVGADRRHDRRQRTRSYLANRVVGVPLVEEPGPVPKRWIARNPAIMQAFAMGLTGEGARQIRANADRSGAADRVRRLSRRRSWRARTRAAQLLRLLPHADPAVRQLLTDERAEVRTRALDGLTVESLHAHIDLVIAACDGPDPATRFAAEQALLSGDGRVIEPLVEAIHEAAAGLLSKDGTSTVLAVAAGLNDQRLVGAMALHEWAGVVEHRRLLVRALASGLFAGAEQTLTDLLEDESFLVRLEAVEALGKLANPATAARIGPLLRDPVWDVRRAAGSTLVMLGSAGLLILRRYLGDDDRFARDMANEMLDRSRLGTRWAA